MGLVDSAAPELGVVAEWELLGRGAGTSDIPVGLWRINGLGLHVDDIAELSANTRVAGGCLEVLAPPMLTLTARLDRRTTHVNII